MVNFNNFEYRADKLPLNPDEMKQFIEGIKDKFLAEIRDSEIHREYLQKYEASSVESFIKDYAKIKADLIMDLGYLLRLRDKNDDDVFIENAREVFGYILQKKLFNLQLQWRAQKINIKEISNSYDFDFWEKHIDYCHFIPPITQNEFNLMKSFLQKNYFSSFDDWSIWQFYQYLMQLDENGIMQNMPDWYDYYDAMMGTGILLQLPDICGKKENFYIDIAQAANREEIEKEKENRLNANPPAPYLPRIYAFWRDILNFAGTYEKDPYFRELFQIRIRDVEPEFSDPEYVPDRIDWAIRILERANHPLIIEGGQIWHKAIVHCAERYITDRVLEALDLVYEEYNTCIELGISKQFTPEEMEIEYNKSMFCDLSDLILKGRELNGEPRNFDFYS